MKILVVGDWHSELHEEAVFKAFRQLGHEVIGFPWCRYFRPSTGWRRGVDSIVKRAQNKYLIGPIITRLNRDLVRQASCERPDMVFVYRGTHILPSTLRQLRVNLPNVVLIGYNNDDPFAPKQPHWLWRHFLACVPKYDLVLAYRHHNIEEFYQIGARRVELLRSWFISERNHPVELFAEEVLKYECDVVFIGHYEPDERVSYLEEIVRHGFKLRLFGHSEDWNPALKQSELLKEFVPINPLWGENYNKALCGAKVALCFFSKLNRDTYTRRCFEIPATGTLMLSEFSDDLASLYVEGEEVDFFRSKNELIKKLNLYLHNEKLRQTIAANGYHRVIADGHDVVTRMKQVLVWASDVAQERRMPSA